MNMRLLAVIGSLAFSFAVSAAPTADNFTLAFEAAYAGDLAQVKRLVEGDPKLVRAVGPPPWKWTLLHRTADGGHADIAAWLVAHGAQIDKRDKYKDTPLHIAADRGFVEIVELLIAHGADVNAENNRVNTAVDLAAFRGHRDVVFLLLDRGAHVDGGPDRNYPVNECVEKGDLECVRSFIAHGASVKSPDGWWGLPMHHLAAFTDVSMDYRSIAAALLAAGAELDPKNRSGETPLGLAAQRGRPEMVSFLLEKGADPNAQTPAKPSILYAAIQWGLDKSRMEDVVARLLEAGADVNVSAHGSSALMSAAQSGYLPIVLQLIDHGADVNRPGADGRTPLWWAARYGYLEVVELLIARGADVNAGAKGQTALKAARMNKGSSFLGMGAAEEAAHPELSARRGNRDAIIQLLEEHGATK